MQLATVVVCFFPDDTLKENVLSYIDDNNKVYLWDNTPRGSAVIDSLCGISTLVKANVCGENKGLPYAYNRIIEKIMDEGYTHIMTMDQDSRFENFQGFIEGINSISDKSVGMYAPPINSSEVLENKMVSHAAQSGCVFNLEMIREIGMFREDFFIGMVDVEMQLRAQEAGYKIMQMGGCNLVHHIGAERHVVFCGKSIQVSDYGPLRHYYDSRNRILMWHEFPKDYSLKGKVVHFMGRLKVIMKIALFEKNKAKKISAIVRGTWNGVFNRIVPY